jgi:cell division septation protein DedD
MTDNFRIQLAALRSKADAIKTCDQILATHYEILGSLTVHIARADLGSQGIYYRVEAGPFDDKTSAKAICDKLKSVGQQCLVKPWPGDRRSFAPNS